MIEKFEVIEDNAGNMFLFFFDKNDLVVLGLENIENCEPGDLDNISGCLHLSRYASHVDTMYRHGVLSFIEPCCSQLTA